MKLRLQPLLLLLPVKSLYRYLVITKLKLVFLGSVKSKTKKPKKPKSTEDSVKSSKTRSKKSNPKSKDLFVESRSDIKIDSYEEL